MNRRLHGLGYIILMIYAINAQAQTGYIYIHKKTLNEESSPDFTFNVTGGPTTVPTITLNDQPTTLRTIASLGGDAAGGLWAQADNTANGSGNYSNYYRAPNSSTWVQTPGAGTVVDGGAAGTRISVASGGVYYYDGTTETNVTGNLSVPATDVADNWLGVQYAVLNNNQIWQRTTASTTWTQIPGISGVNVDAIPNTNQIVYVSADGVNVYKVNNDGTGQVGLGRPAQSTRLLREVAISGDGTIYVRDNLYVYRYTGSGWVTENESLNLRNITGGPTSQLWGDIASTGTNIPNRIHSRTETANYLEDENVRTTPNDNAVLLAVAPGTYTITEGAVANWNLTDITIYEAQSATSTSSIPGRSASVVVSAGEVVHVVFENQLTQTTAVVNVCGTANTFIETFGTGTGYGDPLTGLTSYHKATNTDYGYGYYALINNTNLMGGYAGSYTDHTGDANGRMLGVDATVEPGIFYRRRFTGLLPGIQYDFSAWAMNVNAAGIALPNISFEIYDPVSGNLLNSSNTGNITTVGVWQKSSLVFTATQSTIELVLRNNTPGTLGNDLAIDDITFGLAGPPQPIAATGSATCTGLGSITITSPTGSTIEYSVDGTTYQAGTVFSNLAPGVYSVTARYTGTFACTSTPASVTINSAICGSVFNDVNGLTDNTVNGPGVDGTSVSGTPVYASLVSNGVVIATVPVTSTGTYSFTNVANGAYTVVLTTNSAGSTTPSLPASWTNTGENIGTTAGNDGTPNGILPVTVSGPAVTNVNFGIEQVPTAGSGVNTVLNPGGTTPVPVPTNTFTNTTPSSDVAPGTVTSIIITGFPTNTTSLTINGTVYTPGTFPAGGVVVPTDGNGNPTVPISVDPTNDANPVTIPFKAIDNAGVQSANTGTAVLNFTATTFNLSGNVFDDANGLTDNTVNGPGVNGTSVSGTPVYVSLVSNGVVIATVPLTSTGTYSFSNVANGSYSVVLTTNAAGSTTPSLPASWTSTGENIGTAAGNDGTVNGILPVTVSGASVTNANLGIEQVPTAGSGVNTVLNPGGTTPVPVPTNTFTNTTPSSDVAPGTVTSILITGFPTNTTSLTINGTVYTPATFPAGGVLVPTDGSGNPTVPISVDPTNDANPVSIPFKAIDNAGVPSPNTGTAVLNFLPPVSLSGNVFNDANGLTDNTVNGPGVNGPSLPLYASLTQNGVVVATVPIAPDGTYSFSSVADGAYSVVITFDPNGSSAPGLPPGYISTGENLGTAAGNDGSVNSVLPVTISGTSVTNANFGIEQRPTVTAGTNAPQVNPGGTIAAPVSSTLFTGTDPEDGTYPTNLTGRTVTLTPATNGTLYYNGNPITATTVIPNFDPTKVMLDPTATGATTGTGGASPDPTFTYTVTDNAGVESLPQTIIVPFTVALPVSLVSFTAKAQSDQSVLLEWSTSWERSNQGYTLERSKDLLTFEQVGQVSDVAGTSQSLNTYRFVDATPYSGTSYYRLTQVDLDGTTKVFPAISVVLRKEAYGIFPNPVKDGQFTLNLDEPLTAGVHLYTADGRSVDLQKGAATASSLHLKAIQPLPAGVYVLTVAERGQVRQYRIVIN